MTTFGRLTWPGAGGYTEPIRPVSALSLLAALALLGVSGWAQEERRKARSDDPLVQPVIDRLYDQDLTGSRKLDAARELGRLARSRDKRSAVGPLLEFVAADQDARRLGGGLDGEDRRELIELVGNLAVETSQVAAEAGREADEATSSVRLLVELVQNTGEPWVARKKAIEMLVKYSQGASSASLAVDRRTLEMGVERVDRVIEKELVGGWFSSGHPDETAVKGYRDTLRSRLDALASAPR